MAQVLAWANWPLVEFPPRPTTACRQAGFATAEFDGCRNLTALGVHRLPDRGREGCIPLLRQTRALGLVCRWQLPGRRPAHHVRRDAALFSGCKAHPATALAGGHRGRHGGDEMSEAPG